MIIFNLLVIIPILSKAFLSAGSKPTPAEEMCELPLRLLKKKRNKVAKPEEWERIEMKTLRMQGKGYSAYKHVKGGATTKTYRPERKMGPMCNFDMCARRNFKRRCSSFTFEERSIIHTKFWRELNWDQKKMFVIAHVSVTKKEGSLQEVQRVRPQYYLTNLNNERVLVCRELFLNTLSIGRKCVADWSKSSEHGIPAPSKRKPTPKERIVNDERFKIQAFFDSLPKQASPSSRKSTGKIYLHESFNNTVQLQRSYVEFCQERNIKPASIKTLRIAFHSSDLMLVNPIKSKHMLKKHQGLKGSAAIKKQGKARALSQAETPPVPALSSVAQDWPCHFLSTLPSARPFHSSPGEEEGYQWPLNGNWDHAVCEVA